MLSSTACPGHAASSRVSFYTGAPARLAEAVLGVALLTVLLQLLAAFGILVPGVLIPAALVVGLGLYYGFWVDYAAGAARHEDGGLTTEQERELTIAMLAALEGAFVLARAMCTTQPLHVAGEMVASTVERALAA